MDESAEERSRSRSRGRRPPGGSAPREKGAAAEAALEELLFDAGLQAWRASAREDLRGIDVKVAEAEDEHDEYVVTLQAKWSSVKNGKVRFSAPYEGFESYREKVHAIVFIVHAQFFVVPFSPVDRSAEFTKKELNFERSNLERGLTSFASAFESKGLLFNSSTFPAYVKGLIQSLKT